MLRLSIGSHYVDVIMNFTAMLYMRMSAAVDLKVKLNKLRTLTQTSTHSFLNTTLRGTFSIIEATGAEGVLLTLCLKQETVGIKTTFESQC